MNWNKRIFKSIKKFENKNICQLIFEFRNGQLIWKRIQERIIFFSKLNSDHFNVGQCNKIVPQHILNVNSC